MNTNNQNRNQNDPTFYRFQVFQGNRNAQGQLEKTKTIGMSYHMEGQENYTMRLWTFVDSRFYLLPNHKQSGRYFVMTREPNNRPQAKTKYFWNIVGSGFVDTKAGVIELGLDLFEKPIYMSIFPEPQAHSTSFADFVDEPIAA